MIGMEFDLQQINKRKNGVIYNPNNITEQSKSDTNDILFCRSLA